MTPVDSTWDPQGIIGSAAPVARREGDRRGAHPGRAAGHLGQAAPRGPVLPAHLHRHLERAARLVGRRPRRVLHRRPLGLGRRARSTPAASDGTGSPAAAGPGGRGHRPGHGLARRSLAHAPDRARAARHARHPRAQAGRLDAGAAGRLAAPSELFPALSPDGRWLAYASDESGTLEVYVRPFPETAGAKWQVSTAGGVAADLVEHRARAALRERQERHGLGGRSRRARTFSVGAQRALFSIAPFAGGGPVPCVLAEPRRQAVPGAAGGRGGAAGGAGRGGELGAAAGGAGREVGRRVAAIIPDRGDPPSHRSVAGPTARRSVLGRGGDGIAPFGRHSSRHAGVGLLQAVEVVASTDAPCGSYPVAPAPRAFGKAARALPGPRRAGGADVPRGARQ